MTTTTRRRFVTAAAASAAALQLHRYSFAVEASACPVVAEQEVGPFYVPDELHRSDIAEGKPGVPLTLRIVLLDSRTCTPLPEAAIDLWHCDALGIYSGYTKANFGPPPGAEGHHGHPDGPPPGPPPGGHGGPPPQMAVTDKLTFCRGIQWTDSAGAVTFETIFPGFYQGRVNHIHFKVRTGDHAQGATENDRHTAHVGQVFFPEELSQKLMALEPYANHHIHRTTSAEDGIFQQQHGRTSVARIQEIKPTTRYRAEITLSVDPTATPAPVQGGGFGGPPSRG